jgi:hypothetical protein
MADFDPNAPFEVAGASKNQAPAIETPLSNGTTNHPATAKAAGDFDPNAPFEVASKAPASPAKPAALGEEYDNSDLGNVAKAAWHGLTGKPESAQERGETTTASPMAEDYGFTPSHLGHAAGSAARDVGGFAKSAYQDLVEKPTPVLEGQDSMAQKYILGPAEQEKKRAQEEAAAFHKTHGLEAVGHGASSLLHTAGELIPGVGPIVGGLVDRAAGGDIGGAAAQAATYEAVPKVAEKAAGLPKAAVQEGLPKVAKAYEQFRQGGPEAAPMHQGKISKAVQAVRGALPEGPTNAKHSVVLEDRLKKAQADAVKPQADYDAHEAIIAEGGDAPADVLKNHEKAQLKVQEAQAALDAHNRAMAANKTSAPAEREITPEEVAAARPEAPETPTPTKEQNDAKLSGMMEQIAPTEKPAPVPENVKGPGQVQPETFPQEPTEVPQAFTGMRKLGPEGKQGVMGRQLALPAPREAEGVPEEPKAAEPVPESPKPSTAAEMAGLKAVGGKVTEAPEKAVGPLVKQGLAEGSKSAKPVALSSLGEREKDALGRIRVAPEVPERTDTGKTLGVPEIAKEDIGAKVRADVKSEPRTEEDLTTKLFKQARTELGEDATSDQVMARVDELKAKPEPGLLGTEKELKNEGRTPEQLTKVTDVIKDHSDQDLARLGKKYGVDDKDYDFSARDEKRHRVERDQYVKDVLAKMPDKDLDNISRLSDEWQNKNSTLWSEAERTPASKAQRSRAIMQEHEGGPKEVAGGTEEPEAGSKEAWETLRKTGRNTADNSPAKVGTEEGAKQDTAYFDQAKRDLPNGSLSEQLGRAQELKHDAAIVEEHNAGTGSSILKDGKKVEDGYVVGINKELEHSIDGEKITPKDIKAYRERPDVQKALKDNPKAFIGTWVDGGKTYFDTSIPEPDLETAKKLGKANEQKAIFDAKNKVPISLEEARNYPEGYPESAKEGGEGPLPEVGGGAPGKVAKALPTGDDLIKKYGESDGDPAHTAFILPDGRGVAQTGTIHDEMLGGKTTDADPPRERFIEQGGIRVRAHGVYGNREIALSIPDRITPEQLTHLKKMSPMLRSGAVMIEGARPGSAYRTIDYGKATDETLESTIRELSQVVPANYPKGTPEVGGGAPSAAAAPAKEADLGELAEKHLTPEEKAGVLKSPAQTAKFVEQMSKIPDVQEYTDIANAGAGARKWYQRSAKAFDAMTEEAPEYFKDGDKDKFLNLLAASSPRQSVAMNLRETLSTWKAYVDAGRPEGDALKSLLGENLAPATTKVPNALKALNGEEMWPDITKNKNFKVPSFAKNLRGWLGAVTSDGWMSLFAGLDPREISSAHSYHPLSIATRAAAEELGWEPAEAQAAIWSFTQALQERGEELPEEVRKHSEDFVDLMAHDPQVRDLLADLGVTHANLDAKLAAIGEKPEVSGRTTPTTSRSIERLKERIETARGKGSIPPPKSAQGELGFREAPAHESRVRDADTEFDPGKFQTQTGEDTKLRPLAAKKKSPLGRAKR